MAKTKWLLFDAGKTLLDFRPSMADVVERALAPRGISLTPAQREALEPAMWRHCDRISRERGTRTSIPDAWTYWADTYEAVAQELQLPDPAERALDLCDAFASPDAWQPYPDVTPALQRLSSLGVRMGVVSNWTDALHDILKGLDLYRYFDFVLTSAEVGVEKPDPAIFRPALRLADRAPEQLLYVGDSLTHDLPASTAAGLMFTLIDRDGRHQGAPCHRTTSLHELVAMIEMAG